jgi:sodium/hydrogen exchanger 8
MGNVTIETSSPLESLLFGALLSATDPVATLSILGSSDINADPVCYSLVFGESVLNDAVAIVLFKTFEGFKGEKDFHLGQVFLKFAGVSLGSVFVGLVIGLLNCYLCKNTKMNKYPEYELSVLFLFAYGSYSFSESLQLSGIMSLFFCGMVMSHYNNYNLSASSKVTAQYMFKSLAVLCEFYVYLYLGIAIFTGRMKHFNFLFFLLCMVSILIARAFNIFPLSLAANLFRKNKISRNMQIMIWFAGLRGAIAFALSNNMPEEHRDLYISTTLSIVIFTTVIIGGLTEPMTNYTGMRIPNDNPSPLTPTNDYSRLVSTPDPENNDNGSQDSNNNNGLESKLNGLIYQFDREYMQPVFGSPIPSSPQHSRNTEMVNT